MTKEEMNKLKTFEESYTFLTGVEEATRNSIPLIWADSYKHWDILTWCKTRKQAVETEGDILVSQINRKHLCLD
jgi:hypothetical protein